MHDLRYSVSFQVKIFVLCYLGHFHLDCANFPIQTDFVPKIMNLNLGVILRQLYNSKYRFKLFVFDICSRFLQHDYKLRLH